MEKYYIGITSADQDSVDKQKLSGAICVIDDDGNIIHLHACKERRKEDFYTKALNVATKYDIKESVMVDAQHPMIIQFFKENNCEHYLAKSPKINEENNVNMYGLWHNVFFKPVEEKVLIQGMKDGKNTFLNPLIYEYIVERNNILIEAYSLALMNKKYNK